MVTCGFGLQGISEYADQPWESGPSKSSMKAEPALSWRGVVAPAPEQRPVAGGPQVLLSLPPLLVPELDEVVPVPPLLLLDDVAVVAPPSASG
jgi:hypothetical protein